MPVEEALAEIEEGVLIVMTDDGRVWIPGLVNTLREILPNEGLLVFPSEDLTFIYPTP